MRTKPRAVLQENCRLTVGNAHILEFFVFIGIKAVALDQGSFVDRLLFWGIDLVEAEKVFDFLAVFGCHDRAKSWRCTFGYYGFGKTSTAGKAASTTVGAWQQLKSLFDFWVYFDFKLLRGERENSSKDEAENSKR